MRELALEIARHSAPFRQTQTTTLDEAPSETRLTGTAVTGSGCQRVPLSRALPETRSMHCNTGRRAGRSHGGSSRRGVNNPIPILLQGAVTVL